jgi:hypothetical protein
MYVFFCRVSCRQCSALLNCLLLIEYERGCKLNFNCFYYYSSKRWLHSHIYSHVEWYILYMLLNSSIFTKTLFSAGCHSAFSAFFPRCSHCFKTLVILLYFLFKFFNRKCTQGTRLEKISSFEVVLSLFSTDE